ncbi:hypothetical protein M422DRAFT_270789 [Sphaerobolus stellatus SS14]|uniref:Uncharacterized protein n=1 Tax=Sphaerobolus stellatus (strain SS14) TaxID=990650 RepID=A0A0C9UG49_SPHS4|nr:hypothetical protein M422DRAFT_270789 [Sphaerobolus stellatus SS14]
MVNFPSLFVLAASLTALASPSEKRTVAQVQTDIATITTDVNNLNTAITAFTAGSLAAALNINTVPATLDTVIKQPYYGRSRQRCLG